MGGENINAPGAAAKDGGRADVIGISPGMVGISLGSLHTHTHTHTQCVYIY